MMLRDKLHTKNNENTCLFSPIFTNNVLYSCFEGIYLLSTQKTFNKIIKINDIIPLKNTILLRTHSRTDTDTLSHLNTTNLVQYNNKTLINFQLYVG